MNEKILIVDDEKSIVTLLKFNIEKSGFLTDVAYDGLEAIKKVENEYFDLIILDVMLLEINGMDVCQYLRRKQIETPILMLTAKSEEFDKVLGLELGADDYLSKPFSPKEVVARIKAILRRTKKTKEQIFTTITIGKLIIYPEKYEGILDRKTLTFTRKEFELLTYLIRYKGKILTRDQLLLAVWDYNFVGDTRIVDVHISHLRDKIETNTKQPEYIKTVRGLGYKMEEPTI